LLANERLEAWNVGSVIHGGIMHAAANCSLIQRNLREIITMELRRAGACV
jgi:hypothetical protein